MYLGTKTTKQLSKIEKSNSCTKMAACVRLLSEILPRKIGENINALQAIGKEKYSVVANFLLRVSLVSGYLPMVNFFC